MTEIAVILVILLTCIFLGAPVMAAIGFTAVSVMLIFMEPRFLNQFANVAHVQATSMNLLVAPLFILMSEFLARGGIAEDIFSVLGSSLRKFKGGLAIATTLACTIFASLCGSSPATAASIGRITIQQMTARGYRKDFAVGTVAGGGTLGIMIPPSLTLVTYGILTETSIARLLIAGLIPGILMSILMCVATIARVRMSPALIGELSPEALESGKYDKDAYSVDLRAQKFADEQKENAGEKDSGGFLRMLPSLLLIVVVLGSLYTGLATPTESAGIGAVGAFCIVLFSGRLNKGMFVEAMKATARTSTMIMFLVIAGFGMSFVLSYIGAASGIANAILGSGMGRWTIMIMIFILWYILGALMDPGSMVILTVPFFFTTLMRLGFDPIWLGVVSTLCVQVGMITPPVGLNLFVLRGATDIEMKHIIMGSVPYVFILTAGLVILVMFPVLSLWLPSLM